MSKKNESFEHWIDQSLAELPEWSEPEQFDLNNLGDKRQMYSRIVMSRAKVFRKIALIADDVFELEHPDKKNDPVAKEKFTQPILDEGDYYGVWHYFPWSNNLVQYPDAETHRQLMTSRNRELITADELKKLSTATVAHVGLSVGAHILEQTSHMGLGSKVILADPDIMSVPNLNRIHAGMPEVGMRKTDVAGIRLSELNPYVKQVHLREGITPYNVHVFEQYPPDLLFEEVDHLPTKILMRKAAEKARVPLIMATDTGDRTMIDVERYDIGGVEPFLGALTREELAQIEKQSPTPKQTVEIITKLIGMENISVRLAKSLGQIGISLGGIAQLGTTASVGGAYAAVAGREILLGRGPATGRYKVTPQQVLQTPYI